MSKAVAFLAGLGAGYFDSQRKKKEDERQKARDEREQQMFDATMEERRAARDQRERDQADKDAIRTAAAPVTVQTEVGAPNPAEAASGALASDNPTVGGYRVGAQRFAEKGVGTDAAVAAANTPEATRGRVTAALMAQGKVAEADQLTTSGLQAKAAQITIGKAEREEANSVFDDGVKKALQTGGPQGLAQFMSESHADGKAGALKFQAVVSPDGKSWQMHRVGEDGATQPFGQTFSNDEAGMATAGLLLSRSVPEKDKVAHMLAVKEADRRTKHDEGTLKIAQQNADTNEQWRKDQAANAKEQLRITAAHHKAIEAGKAKAGDPIQVSLKDMREFEGDLDKYIKDQYPVKEGADAKERGLMNAQATAIKANGSSIFQTNAAMGIPLTAGTVLQALELTKDPKNIIVAAGSDGTRFNAVRVNGQLVAVSGSLEKRPAGAAPAAGPAATPAAPSAAAAARSGVAAPAAAPTPAAPQPSVQPTPFSPQHHAAMAPLNEAVAQASRAMAAVANSGDQKAIAAYAAQLERARKQREEAAVQKFGINGARDYIATLPF